MTGSSLLLAGSLRALTATSFESLPWSCPIRSAFHHPCPACGLTRSLVAAARGDLGDSLRLHPFLLIGLVVLVVEATLVATRFGRTADAGTTSPLRDARVAVLLAYALAFTLFGAVRFALTTP